jgi:hypothetical protein
MLIPLPPNTQYYLYIDLIYRINKPRRSSLAKASISNSKTGAAVPSAPNWSSNAALTVSDVTGTGFNLSWPEVLVQKAYKSNSQQYYWRSNY